MTWCPEKKMVRRTETQRRRPVQMGVETGETQLQTNDPRGGWEPADAGGGSVSPSSLDAGS